MSYSKKLINTAIKKINTPQFPGSIRRLSMLTGIPRSSLMNIHSGRNKELNYDNVLKITGIFGLTEKDIADFISDSEIMNPNITKKKRKD